MLEHLDGEELIDWRTIYELEPFGQTWQQTALLAAVICWAAGGKKAARIKPSTFLPVKPPQREMSGAQMFSAMKTIASIQNDQARFDLYRHG